MLVVCGLPARVLLPDVDLWQEIAGLFGLIGGVQAVVLVAATAGVILGAVLWSVGHTTGLGGVAKAGKLAVAGSLLVPVVAMALPGWIGWIIGTLSGG
ncbi:Hypothetical protein AAM4_2632 [Actinomyces succiniciruminis]|uniref:Uncharacterized protein n=1 Tax=Actinomyces succiniciruminis TaxID=1522002 RepID=A0A1L7RSQ8_9ACTO|nr:Hypothetical protein AAM4_2632 [Actinomyces succiniciruminis]